MTNNLGQWYLRTYSYSCSFNNFPQVHIYLVGRTWKPYICNNLFCAPFKELFQSYLKITIFLMTWYWSLLCGGISKWLIDKCCCPTNTPFKSKKYQQHQLNPKGNQQCLLCPNHLGKKYFCLTIQHHLTLISFKHKWCLWHLQWKWNPTINVLKHVWNHTNSFKERTLKMNINKSIYSLVGWEVGST